MDVSALVVKARTGDVDAFTELVRRYQAMAFGYAYSRIGDFHLAEDIVQQAFVAAWYGLPGLKQPERFGGWLQGIVRFECSHLLRAQRQQLSIDDVAWIPGCDEPARLAEEREGLDGVITAINRLSDPERDVTTLYYIHDHSQREVAEFLNLSVTTVNNRLRSARKHLKEERILTMAHDAYNEHSLPDEFAARIGEIVRSRSPIIDARFSAGQRPRIMNALSVAGDPPGKDITIETIQHLEDDLVRGIATTPDGVAFSAGTRIIDTGEPVRVPLAHSTIAQMFSSMGFTHPQSGIASMLETGVKVIDLLCPLPRHGRVALVGDMQSGKMVLVEELIHRLANTSCELTILVFVETPDEVAVINALEYRTSGSVEAIYLPVADTGPQTLRDITQELDAVITFTRQLAESRLFPAIDPRQSTSRLLVPGMADDEHIEVATRVRQVLDSTPDHHTADDDARAERLRHFLTQPFFVAEDYTNLPGQHLSRSDTITECKALLHDRPS